MSNVLGTNLAKVLGLIVLGANRSVTRSNTELLSVTSFMAKRPNKVHMLCRPVTLDFLANYLRSLSLSLSLSLKTQKFYFIEKHVIVKIIPLVAVR